MQEELQLDRVLTESEEGALRVDVSTDEDFDIPAASAFSVPSTTSLVDGE